MLLEKIAIFVIFLGPLVFFHELGHFFFARFFGVRVEVFSIGFGPKIFKKKWGDTEYAISIIPLGGYVKMFGDDPFNKDAIPEEERAHSFTHKSKWARFWIVMGGPLANFILAFVIFFSLLLVGEKLPEIKLGHIPQDSVLYTSGLRTGDVITKINNSDVYNPADLMVDGELSKITVKRLDNLVDLDVNFKGMGLLDEIVKYPAILKRPVIVDLSGNRFFISNTKGEINLNQSIEELGSVVNGTYYLYPAAKEADFTEVQMADLEKEVVLSMSATNYDEFLKALAEKGYRTLDLEVKSVNMGSPADKAGIKSGDIFVSVNDKNIFSFEEVRATLQKTTDPSVQVGIYKNGELQKVEVTPEISTIEGQTVKLIGVYSLIEGIPSKLVQTKSQGFFASIPTALYRTWDSMKKTLDGFVKLITNQVSLKAIGGPLSIGKVAHDSFNTSITYFFQLMALISVNLGIINLFPIPVLDGGHIMFIGLEIINRGPLSRRKMEFAQQIGMALLLMLMVGAIFNDVTRFF